MRAGMALWLLLGGVCGALSADEAAGRSEPMPRELEGVGVEEKLGQRVPPGLRFRDHEGNGVTLGEYFGRGRPVLLTLNYSNCPMLCHLQLNGLVEALKQIPLNPGREFEILTVSVDPLETPQRAKQTHEKYLELYERPAAGAGWHFLTGNEPEIRALAESVGFGYRYDPGTKEYLHVAAAMILSPDGMTTRYLYGIQYDPRTLRFSLIEAGRGRIGTSMDRLLLYCFHFDSSRGRYAPAAFRLMQIGGVLTVGLVGVVLLAFWRREGRGRDGTGAQA